MDRGYKYRRGDKRPPRPDTLVLSRFRPAGHDRPESNVDLAVLTAKDDPRAEEIRVQHAAMRYLRDNPPEWELRRLSEEHENLV